MRKRKILKYVATLLFTYVFFCLITPFVKLLRNRSARNQINYLSEILDKGYDDELQLRFPEGKLFSNCILALSTIKYCESNNIIQEKYSIIIDSCIKRLQSEKALDIFDTEIKPKYGMFCNGWSNYVYTSYKKSQLYNLSSIKESVEVQSKIIEERLVHAQLDSLRVLESYSGSDWPADNFIGIISIENDTIKKSWVKTILDSTEHPSGLVHHSGSNISRIRGSSSAMITFCMSKLGTEEAHKYNNKFTDIFVDDFLGIQLVKENENGSNEMDIDSGPVIFGYGASATMMNIKTQASLNNINSKFTWSAINLITFPINLFGKKFYLLQKEPMFDLFMLWGSVEFN